MIPTNICAHVYVMLQETVVKVPLKRSKYHHTVISPLSAVSIYPCSLVFELKNKQHTTIAFVSSVLT